MKTNDAENDNTGTCKYESNNRDYTVGTTLYIHVHVKLRVMHELQFMCSIIMYTHFAWSGVSAMRYTSWFLRLLSTKHLSAAMSAGHPALLCSSALATTVVQVCRERGGKRLFFKNYKDMHVHVYHYM